MYSFWSLSIIEICLLYNAECKTLEFANFFRNFQITQQQPPEPLPPCLPEALLGFPGECWGPILIPLD